MIFSREKYKVEEKVVLDIFFLKYEVVLSC